MRLEPLSEKKYRSSHFRWVGALINGFGACSSNGFLAGASGFYVPAISICAGPFTCWVFAPNNKLSGHFFETDPIHPHCRHLPSVEIFP